MLPVVSWFGGRASVCRSCFKGLVAGRLLSLLSWDLQKHRSIVILLSIDHVIRELRVPIKYILVIWSFHETFGAYIHSEMKQQITQVGEDLFLVWREFWFLTLTVVVYSKNGSKADLQGRDFRTLFQKSNKVELPCNEEPNLVLRVFSFSNITLTPTQIAKAIWEGMPISPGFWETREDPRYGFEESERQKKSSFTVCTAIIYSWFNKVALGITLWEAIFLVVSQENHCSEFRIFNAQLTTPENTINMPWWSLSPQNFA